MVGSMKPGLTTRISAAIVIGAMAFTALVAFWVLRASASQLGQLSHYLLRAGGLGLLFVAGVSVGILLNTRYRGGGDGGGGDQPEAWTPPPDDIERELQRIIEEERARR